MKSCVCKYLGMFAFGLFLSATWLPVMADTARVASTDLSLNGVAVIQQFRNDQFISALYVETPMTDAAALLADGGPKRMAFRVAADKIAGRSHRRSWIESIRSNNEIDAALLHAKEIREFAKLFDQNLVMGDQIEVDYVPGSGVLVSINGQEAGKITAPGFFPLVLNTWIGKRPPSQEFKEQILGLGDATAREASLAQFQVLMPSDARVAEVAALYAPEPVEEPSAKEKVAEVKKTPPATKKTESKPAASKPVVKVAKKEVPPASRDTGNSQAANTASKAKVGEQSKPVQSTQVASLDKTSKPAEEAVPEVVESVKPPVDIAKLKGNYRRELRGHLGRFLEYPLGDIRRRYGASVLKRPKEGVSRGEVVVKVIVSREGDVNRAQVEISSGEKILDNAALAMVVNAEPLPVMPEDLEGEEFEFLAPVYLTPAG